MSMAADVLQFWLHEKRQADNAEVAWPDSRDHTAANNNWVPGRWADPSGTRILLCRRG